MNQSQTAKTGHPAIASARKPIRHILTWSFLLLGVMVSPPAEAARIDFAPDNIGMVLNPGDEKTISFSASLTETLSSRAYASFNVSPTGGSINRAWIGGSEYVTLNATQPTAESTIKISVPETAAPGAYTASLTPSRTRSNENISSDGLSLYVEVVPKSACSSPPSITGVSAGESIVRARNKKPLTFAFSGRVISPTGCATEKAWYHVTDEYGEVDQTQQISLEADGSFTVTVPIIASRKGMDRDGRLYSVTFGAENEAGLTIGAEQKIIVSHDSRKE